MAPSGCTDGHSDYKFMCKACGTGWPEAANQCWVCPGKERHTYKADGVTYNLLIVEVKPTWIQQRSLGAAGPGGTRAQADRNLVDGAVLGRAPPRTDTAEEITMADVVPLNRRVDIRQEILSMEADDEALKVRETSPGCHRPRKPLHRSQPGHSRRAEASLSPAPTEAVGRPPERPRGEDPPSKGRSKAGKVALVGGGPNCRTWSILRRFPKPGGPPPIRGRAEQTLWGLEEARVMEDTDNDSVLMLRQMYLTSLAYKGLGQLTVPQVGSSFLEHPMDPMECSKSPSSSIWVTRAYIQWASALHHSLIKFDECRLGQVVVKSTALSTDLPLHHWHDLRCNHGSHPRGEKLNSSDLSRYPEQMMQGLAAAILCRARR